MGKRKVFIYGGSLFMAGVKASLELDPDLDITMAAEESLQAGEALVEGRPDAVIFDLTTGQPESVFNLVTHYPTVQFVGVDFTQQRALVLSNQERRVSSMQDLMQALDSMLGSSRRPGGRPESMGGSGSPVYAGSAPGR